MKKWIVGIALLVLVGSGVYVMFGREKTDTTQTAAQAAPAVPAVKASDQIIAEAKVVPFSSVELHFPANGTVAEIFVKEGEQVAKGAPLARLDTRDLELRVAQAQAALDRAKANSAKLQEGASPETIAAARAEVDRAQAQMHQVNGDVTTSDLAAAKARLDQARANLAQLLAGPKTTDRRAAQAALDRANANLVSARDSLSAAKTRAQADVEKAANELRNSQAAYQQIYWDNRKAEGELGAGQVLPPELKEREAAAQRTMNDAEQDLAKAQVTYQEARQNEITGIAAAEATVRDGQANLDKLLAGSDGDKIAAARAEVAQAEATLVKLRGEQRSGSVDAAAAGVSNAQANLDQLTAKPREADLAVAMAEVSSAEVELKQAQLALEQATLASPIAGTVAVMNLKVGEVASTSEIAAIVANLGTWQIETTDLTELSVAHVHEGASVTIKFDALPGVEIPGKVIRIKPLGENKQGDITYTVIVSPDQQDARLRWNMTAAVSIGKK